MNASLYAIGFPPQKKSRCLSLSAQLADADKKIKLEEREQILFIFGEKAFRESLSHPIDVAMASRIIAAIPKQILYLKFFILHRAQILFDGLEKAYADPHRDPMALIPFHPGWTAALERSLLSLHLLKEYHQRYQEFFFTPRIQSIDPEIPQMIQMLEGWSKTRPESYAEVLLKLDLSAESIEEFNRMRFAPH